MNEHLVQLIRALKLCLLALTISSSYGAEFSGEYQIELSDPTQPGILRLESKVDQITVLAENRNNYLFEITPRTDFDEDMRERSTLYKNAFDENNLSSRDNSGLARIDDNAGFKFVLEESNNLVRFETEDNDYDSSFNIVIKVPVNTTLILETSFSGAMAVSGVNGNHELSNDHGAIVATDISGSIVAESKYGELVITMLAVTDDSPMAFSTSFGSVDLTFPKNYSADAIIDSGRGDTYSDFDFEIQRNNPSIEVLGNGRGSILDNTGLRALINGGGATLRIETINGDIYIRQGND